MLKKIIITQFVIIIFLISVLSACIYRLSLPAPHLNVVSEQIISNKSHNTKRMLVIGNSITLNKVYEHWWGYWGMAASSKENDYVHILANKLSQNNNLQFDITNFYPWELNEKDRNQFLELLLPMLNKKPNYVIIQLGDNITRFKIESLEQDFDLFVKYIQKYSPKSKIVIVGNFWKFRTIDNIKRRVCFKNNIRFVSLSRIQNEKFYSPIGSIVKGDDNKYHKIDHIGVSKHPNDPAMRYIANMIYNALIK